MPDSGADSMGNGANGQPNWMTRIPERIGTAILRRLFVVGLLSVLVTIGLFLANISRGQALFYWSAMFPIFGLVCLGHEIVSATDDRAFGWRMLGRQALHWLGPIVAVRVVFLQLERGTFDAPAASLSTLLMLAVTCFLAGVHFDRAFIWVSLFLAFAAVLGTEIEAYIWIIAAIAIAAIIIGVLAALMIRKRGPAAGAG